MASKKQIKEYKVDQKERTVKAYTQSLSERQREEIKLYNDMGYKIIMLDKEKPSTRAKTSITKEDMKTYLKGKIDNKIYNNLLEHFANKDENFLQTKAWLKDQLEANAKKNNDNYVSFNTIIAVEKENAKIRANINAKEYKEKNTLDIPTEQTSGNEE